MLVTERRTSYRILSAKLYLAVSVKMANANELSVYLQQNLL